MRRFALWRRWWMRRRGLRRGFRRLLERRACRTSGADCVGLGRSQSTFGVVVWAAGLSAERRRQSRRTPKVLGLLVGRASTKPPTLLRGAEWGTLRGDLFAWQEVEIEERSDWICKKYWVAAS